jgi:hypothetical protein
VTHAYFSVRDPLPAAVRVLQIATRRRASRAPFVGAVGRDADDVAVVK